MQLSTNLTHHGSANKALESSGTVGRNNTFSERKELSPCSNSTEVTTIASKETPSSDLSVDPTTTRVTHKRTASLGSKSDIEMQDSSKIYASSQTNSDVASICLCQPEPKIPRPRNAFILYRQHRQALVAAQNPKLTNPEISKVIGGCWRTEPESIKEQWKTVADEEKIRHQQQYPEYRYQPRRPGRRDSGGRLASPSAFSSISEDGRCNKCGGRNITTPNASATGSKSVQYSPSLTSSVFSSMQYLPMISNLSLKSPGLSQTYPESQVRDSQSLMHMRTRPEEDMVRVLSPGKRRRLNFPYLPYASRPRIDTPHPFSQTQFSRASRVWPPSTLQSPKSTLMGPPPRPQSSVPARQLDRNFPAVENDRDQSRSVEAMVMSIPLLGKLKVLSSIAPPLYASNPLSNPMETRGALIAIEGDISTDINLCTFHLESLLGNSGNYDLKTIKGPGLPDVEIAKSSLKKYLEVISDWHAMNQDILTFLTLIRKSKDDSAESMTDETSRTTTKPVMLIKGYQLRAADEYASRIPITDAYAPTDHWQWMATLWRGILGADLTIYVKECGPEEFAVERVVEVREDVRCIIIRKERESKDFDETALRRLSFEVSEYIRIAGLSK